MTERLHFHFSLSCTGEGNGNPLQCSCLENPRDGGAWWAAVFGVAQSRTRLKRLSSSSSNAYHYLKLSCWFVCFLVYSLLTCRSNKTTGPLPVLFQARPWHLNHACYRGLFHERMSGCYLLYLFLEGVVLLFYF